MAILNRTIARTQAKSGERPRVRLTPVLLSAALAIVAIAILQLYQTSRATTASFQMQQLEQQKLQLDTSVRQLESEVSTLSSLTRIEQEASRLGLQPADQRDTVQVNVPLPAQSVELPSRFAPKIEEAGVGGDHASWWHRLRKHLPF
jgi:cell division protein FtsL